MRTAVMTDSNSGIKPEAGKEMGIFSLPMPIIIDGKVYFEGKDISQEQFYDDMIGGKDITSSQPSPGDVLDMWDEILNSGYDQVVYIPMSSGLSASCHAAIQLSQDYDGKVQVVDNHRISVTMKESVLEAKYMADNGATALEIKEKLEADAYKSSIYIAVDTLEYLKKGGRVTAAGAAIGSVLNIKPVLTIQGEKLDAFAKVRGMKKAEIKMLDAIEEDLNNRFGDVDRAKLRIDVAGTFLNGEDADEWREMVKERFSDFDDICYDPLSFSIGCHVGPNAVGIAISETSRIK